MGHDFGSEGNMMTGRVYSNSSEQDSKIQLEMTGEKEKIDILKAIKPMLYLFLKKICALSAGI